jgi:hypothetical protein
VDQVAYPISLVPLNWGFGSNSASYRKQGIICADDLYGSWPTIAMTCVVGALSGTSPNELTPEM